jgi:hypothetical protein
VVRLTTLLCRCWFSDVSFGRVSSAVTRESIEASRRGYGSGASDSGVYAWKKAAWTVLDWFDMMSIKLW